MLVNTCDGASGLRRNQAILLELAAHAGCRWSGLKKLRELAREHSIMLLGLGWDIGEVQRLLIACSRKALQSPCPFQFCWQFVNSFISLTREYARGCFGYVEEILQRSGGGNREGGRQVHRRMGNSTWSRRDGLAPRRALVLCGGRSHSVRRRNYDMACVT